MEKREPTYTVVRNVYWYSHCEEQYEDLIKRNKQTKNRGNIWYSNPTPGHISGEIYTSKRRRHLKFISVLFIIARIWKQPKYPLTDECVKNMQYIYTMEYLLNHKKEWNWVICRDVDWPGVCHTEWSKSER